MQTIQHKPLGPIPNKYTFGAKDEGRHNQVTMPYDLYVNCLTKDQRKNGMNGKERDVLYAELAAQWGLLHPIETIIFER